MSASLIETSTNVVSGPSPARQAMVEAQSSRAVAEIQSQMIIAKNFPRDEKAVVDKILNACQRKTLAEVACYEYSKGGTNVTGPSIRLAETMARYWGNMEFGVRELEQREGESTVEAFAHDLETNVRATKVFQVSHIRHTRRGSYTLTDPREIYENVANQGARRVRNCILGIIPGDIVDAAVEQCEATLKADVKLTPERIKTMVDKFAEHGVTKEQIEARIQRRIDGITPAQFLNLMKVFNSLKDGMSTVGDWFQLPEEPKVDASSDVNAKLKGKKKPADDTAQAADPQDN